MREADVESRLAERGYLNYSICTTNVPILESMTESMPETRMCY